MQGGLHRAGVFIATVATCLLIAPAGAGAQLGDLDVGRTVDELDALGQGELPHLPVVPQGAQDRLQQTVDRVTAPLRAPSQPTPPEPTPPAPEPSPEPAPSPTAPPGLETEPGQGGSGSGAEATEGDAADASPVAAGPDRSTAGEAVDEGDVADGRAGGRSPSDGSGNAAGDGAAPTRAKAGTEVDSAGVAAADVDGRPRLRDALGDVVEALPEWAKIAFAVLLVLLLASVFHGARTWRRMIAAEKRASTDRLTGLPNRTSAEDMMARLLALATRGRRPFSVVLFDLDHFKRVNDEHGHLVGDEALRAVGAVGRGVMRESDLVARFGGEEFILLLPETDPAGARRAAEKLRAAVARAVVPGLAEGVTASFGAASFPVDGACASELFAAADRALYRAKDAGRDRVEIASEPSDGRREKRLEVIV